MYHENISLEFELCDSKLSVVCEIDWNGPGNSDCYLKSVNGLEPYMIKADVRSDIEYKALHEFDKCRKGERESQAEAVGDERERGN